MVRHDALVALSDGGETLDHDLRDLVEAALLVPMPTSGGDDAYIFRHALLQEAVYEAMLPTQRRRLHGGWAAAIASEERAHAADAAHLVELAYHWREARDGRALAASVVAGDAAMEAFSFSIALREFEQALALWDDAPTQDDVPIDHIDLLERTSRAAYLASESRRAVAACREAIDELGDGDPDPHDWAAPVAGSHAVGGGRLVQQLR